MPQSERLDIRYKVNLALSELCGITCNLCATVSFPKFLVDGGPSLMSARKMYARERFRFKASASLGDRDDQWCAVTLRFVRVEPGSRPVAFC